MGKFLIFKDADFSANAIGSVPVEIEDIDVTLPYSSGTTGSTSTSDYVRHWILSNLTINTTYTIQVDVVGYPARSSGTREVLTMRMVSSNSATTGEDVAIGILFNQISYNSETESFSYSVSFTPTQITAYLMCLLLWDLDDTATPQIRIRISHSV